MNSFEARLFWLGPYMQEGLREAPNSYLIVALLIIILAATGLFLSLRTSDKHRKKNVPDRYRAWGLLLVNSPLLFLGIPCIPPISLLQCLYRQGDRKTVCLFFVKIRIMCRQYLNHRLCR